MPLLPASIRLFGGNAVILGEHGYNLINTDRNVSLVSEVLRALNEAATLQVLYITSAIITFSTTFACGFMELRSYLVYRTLSIAKQKDFREDARLLGNRGPRGKRDFASSSKGVPWRSGADIGS